MDPNRRRYLGDFIQNTLSNQTTQHNLNLAVLILQQRGSNQGKMYVSIQSLVKKTFNPTGNICTEID